MKAIRTMSLVLRNYLHLFNVINNIKEESVRKGVLKALRKDKKFYKALREITKNTINGKVPLSKVQKKKLRKHKKLIEGIACSKKCCGKKITQSGGFLPILLPSVLAVLSGLLK